jgi:hypothetical protein
MDAMGCNYPSPKKKALRQNLWVGRGAGFQFPGKTDRHMQTFS